MPDISRQLSEIPLGNTTLTGGFWKERLAVNRAAIIPAERKQCQETGRLDVWAWQPGRPKTPHIYWDSDAAKWIEAVACARHEKPDPEAEARVDAYVAAMEKAQAPDGYCNSHYLLVEPDMRWTDLRNGHELYCAGHLIEAAVAYHQATGKDALLNIMLRYVDCIRKTFGTGPGQIRGIPGHPEIELALIRLYHHTRDPKHLELAAYFINQRGQKPLYWDAEEEAWEDRGGYKGWRWPPEYAQSDKPARELSEVRGHAVRAMYFYAAMAGLAAETNDAALLGACHRLWDDLTRHKLYITGGIGSSRDNEGFTGPYDLPNETAYSETCAAIGLVFWAQRLLAITPHRRYADLIETVVHNAIPAGVSLDGLKFFYDNPLASNGRHARKEWFDCSCCPTNVGRFLPTLPQLIADTSADGLWVHQYMPCEINANIMGTDVLVTMGADCLTSGDIALGVYPYASKRFTLRLRIPEWADGYEVMVILKDRNIAVPPGEDEQLKVDREEDKPHENGYFTITRKWYRGDIVSIKFGIAPRYVHAHPLAGENAGRAALMRGPVVYCVEEADNGKGLGGVVLPASPSAWREVPGTGMFKGFTLLETDAASAPVLPEPGAPLYAEKPAPLAPKKLTAIPYALWNNRGPGEMRVWMLCPR